MTKRRSPRALCCTLLISILPAGALFAQGPESTTKLFVPGNYVALSDFKKKLSNGSVTLTVHPSIMAHINYPTGDLQIALRKANGTVHYYAPTSYTNGSLSPFTNGTVSLAYPTNSQTGDCVVVSSVFLHDPNIVTHWVQSRNSGKGGQYITGTDGINEWDYVYTANPPSGGKRHSLAGEINNERNLDVFWGNPPGNPNVPTATTNPYTFATNVYYVFSNGTGVDEDAALPGYERYMAENYSLRSYSPSAAIWLSDRARELTGFPIAHRNYPWAFPTPGYSASAGQAVENAIPVFQVVHCHLVAPEDMPDKQSLATFVLPPNWDQEEETPYPVLFNAQYDLNENTFGFGGENAIVSLAQLESLHGESAVGVLWNGGGGGLDCQATHRSAYDNAAQLFDDAVALLNADKHCMVFTGGSRGGTTALAIASNPYHDGDPTKYDYTAKFVNARAPQVKLGTTVETFMNPTHYDTVRHIANYTGYGLSWMVDWTEPGTAYNGKSGVMKTLFNTRVPSQADALCSDSDEFLEGLKDAGTSVVLRIGTNDSTGPSALMAQYLNHLDDEEIPWRCDIYYRFGHGIPFSEPDDAKLLHMARNDLGLDDEGLEGLHYHATKPWTVGANPTPPAAPEYETIPSTYVPLAIEMPVKVGTDFQLNPIPTEYPGHAAGLTHTWSVIGQPGGRVQVWVGSGPLLLPPPNDDEGTLEWEVVLPASGVVGLASVTKASETEGTWYYYVKYSPDGDTTFETILQGEDLSAPLARNTAILNTPPDPAQATILIVDGEVEGWVFPEEFSRSGGVAEDGKILEQQ